MIKLEHVSKNYGRVLGVNDVSLEINEGEIFGLVGPDGAGKTTLIRMIAGILSPTAGEMRVLGATNPEIIKEYLGYVPQKFSLYGELTVQENIFLLGSLYGQGKEEIEERANQILDFTNLLPFKERLADHLSGGMKQKLALAAGLMHRPKIFLLDEPTTGVDPVSRREFWQMLYRLNKEGTTIIVSTPYMDEAELCSRVAFMHNGKMADCNSPQSLRQNYPYRVLELSAKDPNIKSYLAIPSVMECNKFGDKYHVIVKDGAALEEVKLTLEAAGLMIEALKEIPPTLEDVFVALASEVF
ncbi:MULTISPECIES: ABC transporter ATP-binding protein [Pelosinus]|uniref:ABC transporter related protein n=1 Tax=Pelosinus fermentans B4 TaxID=1149862 RepID=I9LFS5_9FIRM|nr:MULTISPECIES: ABC transporter ATP-binding protein [Pelosinus]EIW19231.1 ABC transporter related protein [Pelosinus fermentans B4]EIW25038.1 ABC transporter related protein [Pelosinus fermentans A11]